MLKEKSKYIYSLIILVIILIILYLSWLIFLPINRNDYSLIINDGDNLYSISNKLDTDNVIPSPLLFRVIINLKNKDNDIVSGIYNIKKDNNLWSIVDIISDRRNAKPLQSITIPEGFDNKEIAERLAGLNIISFDKNKFLSIASNYQGYLFPNTYYLPTNIDERGILIRLLREFDKKVGQISNEDLILASIVEGEAKYKEDMRIVAGILKKRLVKGMRLQVDVDRNTYFQDGLSKEPINNPGLDAIDAVRDPQDSPYYYYLTGKDGKMYYAIDYNQHLVNIRKYLR